MARNELGNIGWIAPIAALVVAAAPAAAIDFFWVQPAGGSFTEPGHWQPFDVTPPGIALGPGGVGDGVHFDLETAIANRYTVSGVAGENHELLVQDDSLTLVFAGDYTLPNNEAGVPNFVVGVDPGDVADVVLTGSGGAVFQPNRSFIAATPGSSGTVTATGGDWLWDVGHQLMVGWYGTGALTIEAGADVISAAPLIGTFDGAVGSATVRGVGSSWTTEGRISVGVSGLASLAIEDGAVVTSSSGILGNSADSHGMVAIHGEGARWDANTTLFLGYDGAAELLVEDGGTLTAGDAWLGGWEDEGFGTATAAVRGASSLWSLDADCQTCDGDLTIGMSSTASLTIEDGGHVANVDGWLGLLAGSSGTATVRGADAQWSNAGTLFVGDAGAGSLLVEESGVVESEDGWVGVEPGATGTVQVRGTRSRWNNRGLLFLGGEGAGELVIDSGGGVANDGVWMALLVGSSAIATVSGVGSTWDVDGALRVGYSDDAALVIEAGGAVTSDTAVIAATFGSTSEAVVTDEGSVWEHGALEVGSAGIGSLTIAAGGVVTSGDATIGDRGTVIVDGADSRWSVGGSLEMETEAQAGALAIGIDGAAQHGVVTVVGSAQLTGSLALTLNGGFVPEASDAFTVLTAGEGITGAFENVASGERIDTAEGGGSFRVTYGSGGGIAEDQVVLDAFVAPEADAALAGVAAVLTALALRRRAA